MSKKRTNLRFAICDFATREILPPRTSPLGRSSHWEREMYQTFFHLPLPIGSIIPFLYHLEMI